LSFVGVHLTGRHADVGTFPIGIEPNSFLEVSFGSSSRSQLSQADSSFHPSQSLTQDTVVQRVSALRRRFEGVKIIVGVDRLDYIKGVPQKLHAMEVFLEEHPEWLGKVVLVQVAVPSRQDVEEYQNLRASVNELVGRINGRFGTVDWMPIHFLHRSIPFTELSALYKVSDACLITSTRDGMNLVSFLSLSSHYSQKSENDQLISLSVSQVAYEYIACQQETHGVLILSEFAGAGTFPHRFSCARNLSLTREDFWNV